MKSREEIIGFFVAPFTATYTFYLAADDEARLKNALSHEQNDIFGSASGTKRAYKHCLRADFGPLRAVIRALMPEK